MKRTISIALSLAAGGCSVFTAYPQQVAPALRAYEEGRFDDALAALPGDSSGPEEMLLRLERGLVAHTAGRFEESANEWQAANALVEGFENRPTISMRSSLEGAASLVLNEKVLPYDGEGFERVLLHSYLALNYLFLGQHDNAYVEVRRAYETQREEERRYETIYPGQGAFARYLGGLVREAVGELGPAYVDYRAAAELAPKNPSVLADCARLACSLGYEEDCRKWRERLSRRSPSEGEIANGAEVVFLFQCGFGPTKMPVVVDVPHRRGITRFAVPVFEPRPNPVASARLRVDDRDLGRSELLEDIESIAKENLKDRMALLAAKSGARAVGKAILTEKLDRKNEGWGSLLGTLFALLTEQPDLRSWLTLPRNVQLLRVPLAPGERRFSVELIGSGGNVVGKRSLGAYRVREGERLIVNLRSVGYATFASVLGGERLERESSP